MTTYRIERAEGGSLPTIVDAAGRSVLALDTRPSQHGRRVTTPTFASNEVAELVLAALNEREPGQ